MAKWSPPPPNTGVPGCRPVARAALADLYWDQYLREEKAGRAAEIRRNLGLVRQYQDGQYDRRLKGDGTLAFTSRRRRQPARVSMRRGRM